ncbi:hypothetical protein GWK47_051649 [Chionoecetes opilio]|uniref:Uncharacterized protein n=1 Tax=Chionoecetes opilio TaxID=41210 RepID=A0A8J4Y8V3_CHIOP|nr:hypothetical protein GWK47_051649 [Chionoecetes opilio]
MTSTRRRPEEPPDDAGFTLQRKRFRVTKPSSQQSGATAAERPIPVWRVVRHDDFPSPYQLVQWLECELRLALKVDVSASGSFLLGGRLRTPPPPSRKWLMANHGHRVGQEGTQQERCPCWIPHWPPLDPVLEHPLIVSAVRCSYSADLKWHL